MKCNRQNKSQAKVQPRAPKAFTLMETLVVIAIICTTMALLVPSAMRTREVALSAVCKSNLKAIGVGDTLYMQAHNDWMVTMGNWYYPSPSGGSNHLIRSDEPSIYQDLWAAGNRWCPTLKMGTGYMASNATIKPVMPAPAPAPTVPAAAAFAVATPPAPIAPAADPVPDFVWSPINYTKYTTFGYARPALDETITQHYPARRLFKETTNYQNPRFWPTYVKMNYNGDAVSPYMTVNYRTEDTRPMAVDFICSPSSTKHITAHNGIIGKTNGAWPGDPAGANAVWLDGSVKWYAFPGKSKSYSNSKQVAIGVSATPIPGPVPEEAFTLDGGGYSYYYPSRRAH